MTFKILWIFIKKCTVKPYSFLVIDTTLASNNSSRFRKNLLEWTQKIIMKIDDRIWEEKYNTTLREQQQNCQHYDQVKLINMDFLQVKNILPFDQSRIIQQAKFTNSPLGKTFGK